MLAFNAAGFFLLYALMRLQPFLPLNPQGMPATSEHLSFNTAVSFVTNTNWQSYGGESTLGYLVQMAGLDRRRTSPPPRRASCSPWRSCAASRATAPRRSAISGPIWSAARSTCCCRSASSWRCSTSGRACRRTSTPTSAPPRSKAAKQTIAQGPVASQLAIKMLGTNGGGFFNANSAHPLREPDPAHQLRPDADRSS